MVWFCNIEQCTTVNSDYRLTCEKCGKHRNTKHSECLSCEHCGNELESEESILCSGCVEDE